jgi:hypothetical protein
MLNRNLISGLIVGSALMSDRLMFAADTGGNAGGLVLESDPGTDAGTPDAGTESKADRHAEQQSDFASDLIGRCVELFLPAFTPTPRGTPDNVRAIVNRANLVRDILDTVVKSQVGKIKAGDATDDYIAEQYGKWLGEIGTALHELADEATEHGKLVAACMEPVAKGVNLPKSGISVRQLAKVYMRTRESQKGLESDAFNALNRLR